MAPAPLARAVVALALAVVVCAACLVSPAAAATQYFVSGSSGTDVGGCGTVAGTGACKTLDYAIDAAAAGDTITLGNGDYSISTILTKSITISGLGRCVGVACGRWCGACGRGGVVAWRRVWRGGGDW